MDIKVCVNGCAATEVYPIRFDFRLALLPLNVDAVGIARYNVVVDDLYVVLRPCLHHNSTRFEMLELALLDEDVGVHADETSRARIISRVTLELAVEHFDAGALKHRDTRHLAVRLSEYSTI